MKLRIRLFAMLRERAGCSELIREFPGGTTVADVWRQVTAEFPGLNGQVHSLSYAVNQEYVRAEFNCADGDEVAFIPPVSGGAPASIGPIGIVRHPIDVTALAQAVADPGAGAVTTFVGTTRVHNAGRRVIRLEYEAYETMALNELRKLAEEACRSFELCRIAIQHRIGAVEIGQVSVAIAVSAAHRDAAFAACRFAIDRIKEIVPIWKKEHFDGGEVWIGCQNSHPPPPIS